MIKKFIKSRISSFLFFYGYLGPKVFFSMSLSLFVGILDGFGLSMFLPLLKTFNDTKKGEELNIGNLNFLLDGLRGMGVSITLESILVFMFVFFLLKGVATYLSYIYKVSLQQEFVKKIRFDILRAFNSIKFKSFINTDIGRIQNTMSGEVERVSQAYSTYFGAFEQGVLVAVYMAFAFFVDVKFAFLVSIGGFLTTFIYKIIYKHTKGASRKLTNSSNSYQGQIIQHVNNFKYLKATGNVDLFSAKLEKTIEDIENTRRKIGILLGISQSVREPLLIGVVVIIIFIQTKIMGGDIAPLLISLLFFYRALTALTNMQQQRNSFVSVSGSLENLLEFQDELNSAVETEGDKKYNKLQKGISIKDVDFSFGNAKILKHISLDIEKSKTVAFVGESGSGKSTLVNLICGLLPYDGGSIRVDGDELSEMDRKTYQKKIGYISQDPVIFNDSIYNNITLWSDMNKQNKARFENVIKQASLFDFIGELPQGMDTPLENNGINLSGGQRQRISIARELFKEVDLLIMDEATSALDSETEKAIQDSIDSLKGYYTIIIIAHRLSTIKNVDKVVFLKDGGVESEGTFEELVRSVPRFRKMVELQEL